MRRASVLTALVVAGASAVYFAPAPEGVSQETMHAAALVILTVGLWAVGVLPEHIVGLIFFTLAMILAVAPAEVVFSGFASNTLWLVLGGSSLPRRCKGAGSRAVSPTHCSSVSCTLPMCGLLAPWWHWRSCFRFSCRASA